MTNHKRCIRPAQAKAQVLVRSVFPICVTAAMMMLTAPARTVLSAPYGMSTTLAGWIY